MPPVTTAAAPTSIALLDRRRRSTRAAADDDAALHVRRDQVRGRAPGSWLDRGHADRPERLAADAEDALDEA